MHGFLPPFCFVIYFMRGKTAPKQEKPGSFDVPRRTSKAPGFPHGYDLDFFFRNSSAAPLKAIITAAEAIGASPVLGESKAEAEEAAEEELLTEELLTVELLFEELLEEALPTKEHLI